MAPCCLVVFVVDDDKTVGPSTGQPFYGQEQGVCQQSPASMEVEPMRRVSDERPLVSRHPPNGKSSNERRDRGMDMNDVGPRCENLGEGPLAAYQSSDVEDRSRKWEFVDMTERPLKCGVGADAVGRGIDPPTKRPEVGNVREQKVADRVRQSRDVQQRDA